MCATEPTTSKEKIAIISPAEGQKFLVGDTVSIKFAQPVASPELFYNVITGTGGWQSQKGITTVSNQEIIVALPESWNADNIQIKIEDSSHTYDPGISGVFSVRYILITSPDANQTFTVGQSVPISWRIIPSKFGHLEFMLSTDSGKSFNDMLTRSISPDTTPPLTWIVGSEPGWQFTYPCAACVLKICEYNDRNLNDISGIFSVGKQ